MNTDVIQSLTSTFEAHAQQTEDGVEYWLARDIQHLLGYAEGRNFNQSAVSKAKIACEVSGHPVSDHFVDANKMIQMPKGAEREIEDILLTRYAKGDQALFGKSTQAMKSAWKVPDDRPLADFAPTHSPRRANPSSLIYPSNSFSDYVATFFPPNSSYWNLNTK